MRLSPSKIDCRKAARGTSLPGSSRHPRVFRALYRPDDVFMDDDSFLIINLPFSRVSKLTVVELVRLIAHAQVTLELQGGDIVLGLAQSPAGDAQQFLHERRAAGLFP